MLNFCHPLQIVNTTGDLLTGVRIEASVWELDGTSPYQTVFEQQTLPPYKTVKVLHVPYQDSTSAKAVYFVLLKLFKNSDELVSKNFYWLHKPGSDYSSLEDEFRNRKVPVVVSAVWTQDGDVVRISARVKNVSGEECLVGSLKGKEYFKESTSGVAFWLHFSVLNEGKGATEERRILPVHYSKNFFSLVPGELIDVQISFKLCRDVVPKVILRGWNMDEVQVPFQLTRLQQKQAASQLSVPWRRV